METTDEASNDRARRLAVSLARVEGYRRHRRPTGGLGAADMRLLWLLVESGPQTLGEVGAALGLERSTVNRQVNAAADAGLLVKARVPGSSAYRVSISPAGEDAFDRGARWVLGSICATLDEMGAEPADTLVELVEQFADAYGRRTAVDAEQ